MPSTLRSMFQQLWANNGDIISKQYAGTNALKVCCFYPPSYFLFSFIISVNVNPTFPYCAMVC